MRTVTTKEPQRSSGLTRFFARHGEIVVFVLLFLIGAVAASLSPKFLSTRNVTNVLRQASVLGIVSVGQTIVILAHGIDLSVGSVATLANCLSAGMMRGKAQMVLPASALGIGVGLLIGMVNGLAVTRLGLADFVTTLATMSIAIGLTFVYTNGREIGSVTAGFMKLSEGSIGPLPMSMVVWALLAIAAIVFLRYARTGRHVYAVGGDEEAARLSGINVVFTKTLAYVLSGVLAAVAGLVLLARLGVGFPLAGRDLQLDSIASVVIGGTSLAGGRGSVIGTVAGVLIVSVLNNIFNLTGVSAFAQMAIKGLVIITVVVIRSRGEIRR